ncbi:MAG: LysR family transcriptional regulator [Aquificae bacterium]|nr:LysR family transcriptional regulator [Aquificota bacterium]
MKLRFKVWFEKEGEPVMTELKLRLLKGIKEEGSLARSAARLGISYKKALGHLRAMEERLGYRVVERKRGAGARLTEEGERLLRRYERVLKAFSELAERLDEEEGVGGGGGVAAR